MVWLLYRNYRVVGVTKDKMSALHLMYEDPIEFEDYGIDSISETTWINSKEDLKNTKRRSVTIYRKECCSDEELSDLADNDTLLFEKIKSFCNSKEKLKILLQAKLQEEESDEDDAPRNYDKYEYETYECLRKCSDSSMYSEKDGWYCYSFDRGDFTEEHGFRRRIQYSKSLS